MTPIIVPELELAPTYGLSPTEVEEAVREQFRAYRATLEDDRRQLLERSLGVPGRRDRPARTP
jgi:hypothetical protein